MSQKQRPRSMTGTLNEDGKKKKKWGLTKMFKVQDIAPTLDKTGEGKARKKSKQSSLGSDEDIVSLQEKVLALQTQISSHKQLKTSSPLQAKKLLMHQASKLNLSTWKNFKFKGILVLRNKYGEEIETYSSLPDEISLKDEENLLQLVTIDLKLNLHTSSDLTNTKKVCFFYYLTENSQLRYDYLFDVTLQYKDIIQEMNEFLESKEEGDERNSFTRTDYCNNHEIKTVIGIQQREDGQYYPIIQEFIIIVPLQGQRNKEFYSSVLSTKSLQNFWFHMEISRKGEEQNTIGPFIPTEQHLSLSGCHYTIEQGIPVPGFSILGVPKNNERKIEKQSSSKHVYLFNYYIRDKSQEDSSLYCLSSTPVSLAEVVGCSEGNQKVGSRFKLEKLSDFGFIRMVFHFLVCEELIPEPSTDSDLALNPLFGYWLLEKISISIRV